MKTNNRSRLLRELHKIQQVTFTEKKFDVEVTVQQGRIKCGPKGVKKVVTTLKMSPLTAAKIIRNTRRDAPACQLKLLAAAVMLVGYPAACRLQALV